jgi:DNA (cytosine-5)-methyltransferase 1
VEVEAVRPPAIRASFDPSVEMVVDNFAGGGGASTGLEGAIGRVDIAVNHDPEAIAVHEANHPETHHYLEDIWEVDPREACGGRRVGVAWFSPACTHFSRAKGAQNPRSAEIRGLSWVVVRWAELVRPRVIFLENVAEFAEWGPLDDDGKIIKSRKGETFRAWLTKLTDLGYRVEFRSLVAADYGAPTTRKRLYLVARCDDRPIVWPTETHGDERAEPWRQAAEVIDWSLACPSIFERKRPLADATLARIARGIQRYVVEADQPYLIPVALSGEQVDLPFSGDEPHAAISPFIVRHGHYSKRTGAGLREGCGAGTFRGQRLRRPLATVCATNDKHVVVPLITKHYTGMVGHGVCRTLGTITAKDHHSLTAAWLTKFYGTSTGSPMTSPVPTVTANGRGGGHLAEVRAFLTNHGTGHLVELGGETFVIADIGMRMLQPVELFAAQGFPPGYVIAPDFNGKPLTKTAQIRLAGNSVCPPVAEQLVRANLEAA